MTKRSEANFEKDMLRRLKAAGSPWPSQVDLEIEPWNRRGTSSRSTGDSSNGQPDFRVRLLWNRGRYEFVAEAKNRSTPSVIETAVQQAKRYADQVGLPPMVIVPYLDDVRMDRLAEEGVSGLDLSGNGIVMVPGRLLLRRSGNSNRYPESQPMRFAYRGATSVVPRVFLCKPRYESVSSIKAEIEGHGGEVALSTVSKALARMVDDVLIDRASELITLLQPDALLDKLAENFRPSKRLQTIKLKSGLTLPEIFKKANRDRSKPRMVLSGASSQDRYAAGLRSDEPLAYCDDLAAIRTAIGKAWQESERFADLTIIETDDRTPFFDARTDPSGMILASPVQAYLELAAGDKRDREMAQAIRHRILRDLKK